MSGPTDVSLVEVRGLRKAYGESVVLDSIDLDVSAGEILAVIGPSGSGKSTLLRILMGLERPDGGRVTIAGRSVWTRWRKGKELPANEESLRRAIEPVGMVFQQFNLFPNKTVLENVALAPRIVRKWPKARADELGRTLLERVGLANRADEHPHRLSGGQKQRVAIARALAMEPSVLLCDEITSALDPELVGEVLDTLEELARADGLTLIVVTHEMAFARDVAHRIVLFDGGSIVESGPPQEIFESPREERTKAFLARVTRS